MQRTIPFLVLTSDSRFWDTSREVVFLGEWCLAETRHMSDITFPYIIIHTPWDSNRDIDSIGKYIDELSEKLLIHLSQELDKLHGLDWGLRIWRIIAGNWVFHAVHTLFDRFFLLDEAIRLHGKLTTRIPLPREADVPKTISNFKIAQMYPDTSLLLFGRLAEAIGLECERIQSPEINQVKSIYAKKTAGQWKEKMKDIVRPWLSIGKPIIFCDSDVRAALVKKMNLGEIGVTTTEQWNPLHYNAVNIGLRTKLFEGLETVDSFYRIAIKVLPYFLPTSLLEDFELWNSKVQSFPWGSKAKIVVTAYGFNGSELFSLRAARLLKRGCNLVGMQHGGAYGITRYCTEELHETKCSDFYVTWGWRGNEKQFPMPSLHLAEVLEKKRSLKAEPNGILLVTTGRPHLAHRIASQPLSGQISRYYLWQERFYEQLSPHLKSEFFLKPFIIDHIVYAAPWLDKRSIRVVSGHLTNMLNKFRLLVFDSNGTGFLETMACNIPTLIFWDQELWELKDSAISYFEKLSKVGIFHTTPESAAMQVNKVFENVEDWWISDSLQNVRNEFCDTYARVNDSWEREWTDFLQNVINLSYDKC